MVWSFDPIDEDQWSEASARSSISKYASPVAFAGPKRYSNKLLAQIEDLPDIDVVLITNDHYGHLDYESIRKLKGKVKQFIVPLGVAGHLTKWGVGSSQIKEL
ncbi:MBL fold metallo-hydrolase [Paenibacillus taichungensis]|uniref:MBL fold metallo-hydrolase n=1 Tax=Paenibacillus taichungensis TaxID=484184 RepID=UPI0039A4072D